MTAALAERPAKTRRTSSKATPKVDPAATTPEPETPVQDAPEQVEPATEPAPAETETTEAPSTVPSEGDLEPAAPAGPSSAWDHAAIRERREGLGLSRQNMATLTGLAGSRIWRSETPGGDLSAEHQAIILAALDKVDAEGLPDEFKKATGTKGPGLTKDTLAARLKNVVEALHLAGKVKTVSELRHVVSLALNAAEGTTPQVPKTTEPADTQPEATDAS